MTLRVGDRVAIADKLPEISWPPIILSRRKPGSRGTIEKILTEPTSSDPGCYLVRHDGMLGNGSVGQYLGDELLPIRESATEAAAPSPERVQLEELSSRLTALEQRMGGQQDENEIPDIPAPPPSEAAATIALLRERVEELEQQLGARGDR